jgi:hypothetical protein
VEGSDDSTVCHGLKQLEVSSLCLSHTCIISQHMVDRVTEIKINFDEIAKDQGVIHLREDDGLRYPQFGRLMPTLTSHFVDESSVFGRKKEKDDIVRFSSLRAVNLLHFQLFQLWAKVGWEKSPFSITR